MLGTVCGENEWCRIRRCISHPPRPSSMVNMSAVGTGSVPERSALVTSRRELTEDVSSGIGTLLVAEQSSFKNRPRGVWYTPSYTVEGSLQSLRVRSKVRFPGGLHFFLVYHFLSSFFVRHRLGVHNRVPGPDILYVVSIILYAAVLRMYESVDYTSMYLDTPVRHVFLLLLCVLLSCCCCSCGAAACCCCSSSCAGWRNLFLWFIASDSSVFFLFVQTRYIFNVPRGSTVACTTSIYL